MPKIAVSAILGDFQRMLDEHWKYTAGAAETGNVDCSGAFVWSYRQHGQSIYHGSNRIARTEIVELVQISAAKLGMAVFKCRNPGDSRYALPSGYKQGGKYYNGDLRDFYHIRLMGEDGKVLNAQSSATGFVASPVKSWTCAGYLKKVEYKEDTPMVDDSNDVICVGLVTAQSGSTVNLRAEPSKSAKVLEKVKIGTSVNVIGNSGGWLHVETETNQGYMMEEFVDVGISKTETPTFSELAERIEKLEERVTALEGGVG